MLKLLNKNKHFYKCTEVPRFHQLNQKGLYGYNNSLRVTYIFKHIWLWILC